jgi:hypothetical protein
MWVNRYWRALLKSPMRTMGVVVVLVLGQDLDELALVEDQHPVQALAADGARGGLRRTAMPESVNTASKLAVNFVSRSRTKNRKPSTRSASTSIKLRAC